MARRRELKAGDLVLLPFAAEHKLWRGEAEFVPASNIVTSAIPRKASGRSAMAAAAPRRASSAASSRSAEMMFAPMFRTLPEMLVDRADDEAVGSGIAHTIDDLLARGRLPDAGRRGDPGPHDGAACSSNCCAAMPAACRRAARACSPRSTIRLVGRALQLMQADPARRWTTDELAREVGASRTVLGERFNAVLGKPPIEYLTGWRIQLAADRLRNGRDAIARIAVDSGY